MTTTREPVSTGDILTIRKSAYRVFHVSGDMGDLGSKFFNKRIFTLVRIEDGIRFRWFGKRPTANARPTLDWYVYSQGQKRPGLHDVRCHRVLTRFDLHGLMCPCMVDGYAPAPWRSRALASPLAATDHHPDCDRVQRPRGEAGMTCDCAAGLRGITW